MTRGSTGVIKRGTKAPDPENPGYGGFSRRGLGLATATASALGIGATVAALGIHVMFLGVVLGAVVGTALVRGKPTDCVVGAVAAVIVVALCVEVGVVVPAAAVGGSPPTAVGGREYALFALGGIPVVVPGAFGLDWIRRGVAGVVVG